MNNFIHNVQSVLVAIPIIALSSCASIVSKSQYPVSITSHPEGTAFRVVDQNNEVIHEGYTPETITLASSAGYAKPARYSIMFEQPAETDPYQLSSTLDPWYFGNIGFGGIIGMLAVDPLTGAMWKLPKSLSVDLDGTGEEPANPDINLTSDDS